MTILDYVYRSAQVCPNKPAIIHGDRQITYSALYSMMQECAPLPIPLLGEAWDQTFCLHTTGTTGQAKDVLISQQAVVSNSENLIHAHGYSSDTVFVLAGALDHLGCWSKIFPVLMQGGTLIILDNGMKDVNAFFEALNYPSTHLATFLVPAVIRMLLSFSSERLSQYAHKIEFIETGASAISQADMEHLCAVLPHTRLFNTYASTETGILCTHNFNAEGCIPGCVGRPMLHSHVFITPEGQIACKGPTLMSGYRADEIQTSRVMREDIFYTADNGRIDEEGRLHILGRRDDIINVGGYKVSPLEVEDAALSFASVSDCICIPVAHSVTGNALKLLVVPSPDADYSPRALAQFLKSRLQSYQVPLFYERVDHIKRTHNGKLNRRFYAAK